MKKKLPPKKRAIELYHRDSPFRQKIVQSKKKYTRKMKFKDDRKCEE